MFAVILIVLAILGGVGLLCWIARCVGKIKCASRLGVGYGWMTLFPLANAYMEGCMAAAGDRLRSGEHRAWRIRNLLLRILCLALGVLAGGALLVLAASLSLLEIQSILKLVVGPFAPLVSRVTRNIVSFLLDRPPTACDAWLKLFALSSGAVVWVFSMILILARARHFHLLYKIYVGLGAKKPEQKLLLSVFVPLAATIILLALGFSKSKPIPVEESSPEPAEAETEAPAEEPSPEPAEAEAEAPAEEPSPEPAEAEAETSAETPLPELI